MRDASTVRFDWLTKRGGGVLLHPTSLPSPFGIGTLGGAAHAFLDFLAASNLGYWQILPLGPTGYGDSPYSAYSVFAGNHLLIDPGELLEHGLLRNEELAPLRELPTDRVDFGALTQIHRPLMRLAARRFRVSGRAYLGNHGLLEHFRREQADWLVPYARFMALREQHGDRPWWEWPEAWRHPASAREAKLTPELEEAVETHVFLQYIFAGQWRRVRQHARERNIQIIGDLPIYAERDSADTWAERRVFLLDEAGEPSEVAGVPPDYFSETGQLWGNPLYDWEALAATGYDWWIRRLRRNFDLCDVVRLDHFRAFYDYWAVPAHAPDARAGTWRDGPREAIFAALKTALGEPQIIAEDLGEIGPEVYEFLRQLGLPGMAVLQFAFDGRDPHNAFLPHNLSPNSVVYPGTHDNDTTAGWYAQLPGEVQDQVRRYYRVSGEDISWDFVRSAFASVSRLCVVSAQDLLLLDARGRMNRPGVAEGNWSWRLTEGQMERLWEHAGYLRELTWLYGR